MAETFTNPAKIARQLATNDWLDFWGSGFEIFTSTLAIEEAKRGHHGDVARAIEGLDGIIRLPVPNAPNALTEALRLRRALTYATQCRTKSRSLSPMFIGCPLTSPRILLHDLFVYLRLMSGRQRGVDSFEDIGYRWRGADLVA